MTTFSFLFQRTLVAGLMLGIFFQGIPFQSLHADTLVGTFSFEEKAPPGALIYVVGDHSLKQNAVIDQKDTEFTSFAVVGPKDSTATFRNSDSINHNIYASDKETQVAFDIGLAPPGSESKQMISWEEEQMVRISCKIHPKMKAWVVSLSSKYYQILNFDKKQEKADFSISDVPSSLTQVKIWMPGYAPLELIIKKGEIQKRDLTKENNSDKVRGSLELKRS